jgi:hypothetical protein
VREEAMDWIKKSVTIPKKRIVETEENL